MQKSNFEQGTSEIFHNLYLQPDIKAFDGVRVRSLFYLAPQPDSSPVSGRKFYSQEGRDFGLENTFSVPLIAIRDLYLELEHDFGLFQVGWKPHHFGLGMYYNDSSDIFSPVYNLEGSKGFISWRGFIGSSYYIQPLIHYMDSTLFNLFIQAGFSDESYGAELIYKTSPLGIEDDSQTVDSPSYFGFYGYYKISALVFQLEVGRNSEEVYGGVMDIEWETPVKWLALALELGGSTSDEDKAFYFDPSFSSRLSFLIEKYEMSKPKQEEYLKQYVNYSFHSAFYIAPSISFSLLDSLILESVSSLHLSFQDMNILLYHTDLILKYELAEGLLWHNRFGCFIFNRG